MASPVSSVQYHYRHSQGIRNQALSDSLAHFPFEEYVALHEDVPAKRYVPWITKNGILLSMVHPPIKGTRQELLYDRDGTNIFLSFRLDFLCSNKEAEFKALGTRNYECKEIQSSHRTSQGEFALKNIALASYRIAVQIH